MAPLTDHRRRLALLAAMAVIALALPVQAQRLAEYQVKAAFLQGFAKFVEWPSTAAGADFAVCILGDDPFGQWIDDATAGTRVRDRAVVVRRIRQVGEAAACQTLFIGASEEPRLRLVLDGVRGLPVLTVSDLPQFAQQGGMLAFTTVGGRVRFVANPGVARAAGLQLASELLRVAADVVGRAAPQE